MVGNESLLKSLGIGLGATGGLAARKGFNAAKKTMLNMPMVQNAILRGELPEWQNALVGNPARAATVTGGLDYMENLQKRGKKK
jgi:hypothetical protein